MSLAEHQTSFSELFCLSFFFYFVMSFSKLFSRFLRTFQCCSEISLLFNFQRPNESAICRFCCSLSCVCAPSTWQLTYYTSIVFKSQYLFQKKFIFFITIFSPRRAARKQRVWFALNLRLLALRLDLYTIFPSLAYIIYKGRKVLHPRWQPSGTAAEAKP